jgi:hypothetical protein
MRNHLHWLYFNGISPDLPTDVETDAADGKALSVIITGMRKWAISSLSWPLTAEVEFLLRMRPQYAIPQASAVG